MATRDQWSSRAGFILVAMGSAIGLGNIWRYPYTVYENGGGAFLIPYFVALLTAGIPLLLLEYSLGHRFKGAAPLSYRRLSKKWEWVGWWQVFMAFFIVTYYTIIIGWALSYTYFSVGTQWGDDTNAFFFGNYLNTSDSFWDFGGLQWKVLLPVILVWIFVYFVMRQQAHKGIERLNRFLLPALIVMLIMITIRGVTLEGATEGLNVLLTPDFSALTNPSVWVAAYGQVFFSLSVGFATMITYASYLDKKTDLSNSGFIAALSNSGFEFLAALGIFGALGYLAHVSGSNVNEVVASGIGLAFVVFPQIINTFPGLNDFFGLLFFGSLTFAGLTSAVSLLEPGVAALRDKFNLTRTAAVNWVCGGAALVSLLYTTGGGIMYLDVVDNFINQYGLLFGALAMITAVAWVNNQLDNMQGHINQISDVYIGAWWKISVKYITPIMLLFMLTQNLADNFMLNYEGYPMMGNLSMGWGVFFLSLLMGIIVSRMQWKANTEMLDLFYHLKEGA
ncbi:sodium-dependent transporter [Desmospora activa]|uniref:NSS family neurotransmitter:Na+ symporter n=1 Tax=Desmospora activa DSM 45169 TaxID=1121389 RepID=A0A2T4Z725_9BACL|nr:sodium-dependent transporter [Desmospora activa]PTM57671.1 NSS family neurotransmitter:Na+ symporter [Desmospora activa DSM 45169]